MFDKENIIVNTDWLTVERKDGKTIELTLKLITQLRVNEQQRFPCKQVTILIILP